MHHKELSALKPFVVQAVKKYKIPYKFAMTEDDVRQEAWLAVIKAQKKFDASLGHVEGFYRKSIKNHMSTLLSKMKDVPTHDHFCEQEISQSNENRFESPERELEIKRISNTFKSVVSKRSFSGISEDSILSFLEDKGLIKAPTQPKKATYYEVLKIKKILARSKELIEACK